MDSAYPLLSTLMVPFKTPGNDPDLAKYNLVHSKTRQRIEHSFGYLTARLRFLWKHVYLLDMLRISQTIYTCCVLLKICINEDELVVDRHVEENPRFVSFIAAD